MNLRVKSKLDQETEILISNVIGAAIEVHRILGPGYLENTYEDAMSLELELRNISYQRQVPFDLFYKGKKVQGHYVDMLVQNKLILEFKAVDKLIPMYDAQILSYLATTGLKVGLLINYRETLLKNGIKRFVLTDHSHPFL